MLVSDHDDKDYQMKIVDEMKIAETGFESAPQAVMQLYLAFHLVNNQSDSESQMMNAESDDSQRTQNLLTGNCEGWIYTLVNP